MLATPFGTFVETFVAGFVVPADFSLSAFQLFLPPLQPSAFSL
jgi:hypothetical protein